MCGGTNRREHLLNVHDTVSICTLGTMAILSDRVYTPKDVHIENLLPIIKSTPGRASEPDAGIIHQHSDLDPGGSVSDMRLHYLAVPPPHLLITLSAQLNKSKGQGRTAR